MPIFLAIGDIGAFIAYKIPMTAMPELVAGFHSLVGLATVFVAISAFINPAAFGLGTPGDIKLASLIEMAIGAAVDDNFLRFCYCIFKTSKLCQVPITFKGPCIKCDNIDHYCNFNILFMFYSSSNLFWTLIAVSFLIGFLIIIPIGGADMPVVISMLILTQAGLQQELVFTENTALIITGALVGSSGAILSYIMCKGMNDHFLMSY